MHFQTIVSSLLIASASAAPISWSATKRTIGEIVTDAAAAVTAIVNTVGTAGVDAYTVYSGDGSSSSGWPSVDQWASYDNMWTNNQAILGESCSQFGQANNSPQEINNLNLAIQQVAAETKVDDRFILAIVLQESKGCVRAPTTNYGVNNPGLMQDHDGAATCFGINPCPAATIYQMIRDGTAGTAAGPGLAGLINQEATGDVAQTYYRAARAYNSGSVAASGILQDGIATACYASDVANRVRGWSNAATKCTF